MAEVETARRHDRRRPGRWSQARDREGRRPPPGPRRSRRGCHRRRQPLPARQRAPHRHPRDRQSPRSATSRSPASSSCAAPATTMRSLRPSPHCARRAKSGGNLLAASIAAARARATLGEISAALEAVFGRHAAITRVISGVYAETYANDPQFAQVTDRIAAFEENRKSARPRSSSPRWGRTVTIAAPRSSPPPSPISASPCTWATCSKPPPRSPITCASSGRRRRRLLALPPVTRPSSPN